MKCAAEVSGGALREPAGRGGWLEVREATVACTPSANTWSRTNEETTGHPWTVPRPPTAGADLGGIGQDTVWFHVLFEESPDAIYLLDPHDPALLGPLLECNVLPGGTDDEVAPGRWSLAWPIVHGNAAAHQRAGYRSGELAGQPAGLIGPQVAVPDVLTGLLRTLRREPVVCLPATDQCRNGALIPVEVCFKRVLVEGRELVLASHRDLSRQQAAEVQADRFLALARTAPVTLLELNSRGGVIYANPAAEALAHSFGEATPAALLPPGTAGLVSDCLASERAAAELTTCIGDRALRWSFHPLTTNRTVLACAFEPSRVAVNVPSTVDPGSPAPGLETATFHDVMALLREMSDSLKSGRSPLVTPPEWERAEAGLLAGALDAFLSLDQEGRILSFNPAAERLTGYAATDMVGRHFARSHLLEADSLLKMLRKFDEFLTGRATRPVELVLLRQDAAQVFVEGNAWAEWRNGEIAGTYITFRDITERVRSEEALRRRDSSLSLVERISHVGSWELDLLSGALSWSEEMFRLFGLAPGGKAPDRAGWLGRVRLEDREVIERTFEESVKQGRPHSLEYRILRPDETECWVLEQADVIFDEHGGPVRLVGTLQDITRRKQHEEQLRQIEKWEAIGRLAGGVAHDFNSILAEIRNCAACIGNDARVNGELAAQIKRLSSATERATHLTWQLLAYTRRQSPHFKPVQVNELIHQMARTLQPALGAEHVLTLTLAAELPVIPADIGMLEQVMLSAVIQSWQACPKGGRVRIETRMTEIDAAQVRQQPAARPGCFVCVSFSDEGRADETRTSGWLFEPFFTTREHGTRSGLGLATVDGIVKQHQGWVDVVRLLNHGRSLRIYLPATRTMAAESSGSELIAPPIRGGTETVLLVEANQLFCAVTRSILERYGYQVLTAATGGEALAVGRRHGEKIELLLLDLGLAGEVGAVDLVRRLRSAAPELKVLYTSEYRAHLASHPGPLRPGFNFLPKPCSATAVAQAVRQCLDSPPPASNPPA
jgi:two-component system, cell cycle sensor histidine kinase and response regulator CckA